ncbi:MAG TPA: hypothetical protein VLS88_08005 [Polyangiales bacterium]|nr:hypothetical protein [Polyangiales bacterium]
MLRLPWLGALLAAAVGLGVCGDARRAAAQVESDVEIITAPPSESPSPSIEPPAAPPASVPVEPERPPPPKQPPGRLRVGGGIGFGVATGFLSVGVSPQVSYIFKRIVEPGLALRYEYTKDSVPVPDVSWHTYGGSIFVRLFPIQMLFFLVEGELINTGFKQGDFRSNRTNYGNLLLGGGFMLGVGKGVFVATAIKFAVLRNPFYPDAFPIIAVGAGYTF